MICNPFFNSYANQSVEDIIKGRKAMFSENYQNAKRISTLLKSGKIDENTLDAVYEAVQNFVEREVLEEIVDDEIKILNK